MTIFKTGSQPDLTENRLRKEEWSGDILLKNVPPKFCIHENAWHGVIFLESLKPGPATSLTQASAEDIFL